jgi:hypothetical protein
MGPKAAYEANMLVSADVSFAAVLPIEFLANWKSFVEYRFG